MDWKRATGERNEIESTFETSKSVYRADNIRAKLDVAADTWIGTCSFAKKSNEVPKGLNCLIFSKMRLEDFKERLLSVFEKFGAAAAVPKQCTVEIN